ncbi:hypothetical protein FRB94_000108 [Tulasnella sp. JGI-2019a]|nr:hypothetical protein FRB94_000108 [Tulasnella sp. JGI-2019a]
MTVAVTPDGLADAVKVSDDGQPYFTEPYAEKMTMNQLFDVLRKTPTEYGSAIPTRDVYYLQSQNGNLGGSGCIDNETYELKPLSGDVTPDVPWATEALDRRPDAVNLWIGDSRSITSVHSDPYENIYTVIRGEKHFTLLPPTEGYCLDAEGGFYRRAVIQTRKIHPFPPRGTTLYFSI